MYEALTDILSDETIQLFEDAHNSLPKKMRAYAKASIDSLALNDLNIEEKAMVAPSIHHGYLTSLFAEKGNLTKLEELREAKEEEFRTQYGNREGVNRYETKALVSKEDIIVKIESSIIKQREIIKYLEEVCRILSTYNFSVKNSVELRKLGG